METVKPPALAPGAHVGVVATSSPVSPEQLRRVTGHFEARGHPVKVAPGVLDRLGFLAGTAERRAAGVMAMFADPDVGLVVPANGGAGAEHLVDRLDYPTIRANPKLFTGFSNPTSLNNAIWSAARVPSLHGISGFQFFPSTAEPWTENAFWAMATGSITGHEIPGPHWRVHRAERPRVSGPVVGGNLTAFRTLVGTRWMPPTAGAILLIEAMTATFESIDTALTHLRLAGVFRDIAALVIGAPADWPREDAPDADVDELVLRCVGDGFPVVTNVEYGHQPRKIQFPIGCRVEFDLRGQPPVLRYLEDLVRV
ncbi:S66 peptidase family protein [Streptomyces millisiae]|uniref:LD-carboxypeptidase n=1 Tax=Streptomyces millisiae TaxID=3075542 RepID=A0ABU2LL26_9ACTN|nr:LD-carboxypeptidase [Streptomyces sp. DSM 44918]MDT0318284.1 LD-carboxypeptidase [Streptomyces sp. DSM 44918]